MKDAARYPKIVEWSEEDQCFIGSSPGLIYGGCHGDDEKAVFKVLCGIVEEAIELYKKEGKPLPAPSNGREFAEKTFVIGASTARSGGETPASSENEDIGLLPKDLLGLAGEFAVAAELCRRGLYAQLTLGNRKKVDILIASPSGVYAGIEVKTKQGNAWPGVKGISPKEQNRFLVLVDYQKREPSERPRFYVLGWKDWKNLLPKNLKRQKGTVTVDVGNVPHWTEGRGYHDTVIKADEVKEFEDQWDTILAGCR
jgi:predicted RNase H-like HicB family nuclease